MLHSCRGFCHVCMSLRLDTELDNILHVRGNDQKKQGKVITCGPVRGSYQDKLFLVDKKKLRERGHSGSSSAPPPPLCLPLLVGVPSSVSVSLLVQVVLGSAAGTYGLTNISACGCGGSLHALILQVICV